MLFAEKSVIPAVNNMKDYEKLLEMPIRSIVVLDSYVSQIAEMVRMAKRHRKHLFLHADLIQGLKNDLYAAEFICQDVRPAGIISTRSAMLDVAKKRGLVTVLRIFLLDSRSIETSYRQLDQMRPDMVEVLPGLIPSMIGEVRRRTGIPVIAGGLIRTREEVENAFNAGAVAVSTSNKELWDFM
ncbi:glycerol-3-phosphate responsive antiterminator [Sporolactobacillus sp. CQH2019]|uniref:glycerol-3-phosphate responsive antiterminator n=1 Tax=Sporolactobacillus sp. CQH2019 TaxID=3023512 RepID=UPI00236760E5|nr:glycerol-3-phosphate responsive antiterminator [Sporolactobacillus sp. CQH2019]MDD9149452.1 glycerol-3-phosphate responsive antiterminator [Sporolactobacillus sp. CQH2019]